MLIEPDIYGDIQILLAAKMQMWKVRKNRTFNLLASISKCKFTQILYFMNQDNNK